MGEWHQGPGVGALNQIYIRLDGTSTTTATIPFAQGLSAENNLITNVQNPAENKDAANKEYVDLIAAGLELLYFFTTTASDIPPYYLMDKDLPSLDTVSSRSLDTGDDQLIFSFITDPSQPHIVKLAAGNYTSHIHIYKTGTKSVTVYFEIYKRDIAGTETLIATSGTTGEIQLAPAQIKNIIAYISDMVDLELTDRIIVKWYANVGAAGSAVTVNINVGETQDSHFGIKVNALDLYSVFIAVDGTSTTTASIPFAEGITIPDLKTLTFANSVEFYMDMVAADFYIKGIAAVAGKGTSIFIVAGEALAGIGGGFVFGAGTGSTDGGSFDLTGGKGLAGAGGFFTLTGGGGSTTGGNISLQGGVGAISDGIIIVGSVVDVSTHGLIYKKDLLVVGKLEVGTQAYFDNVIESFVGTGVAPFQIASTTVNTNLNADLLDGYHASAFEPTLTKGNLTATSPISLDQTRQVIGGAAVISHLATAGNIHLPTGGSSNQILKNSGSSGTGAWGTVTENAGALGSITTIGMSGVLTSMASSNQIVLGSPTSTTLHAPGGIASITITFPTSTTALPGLSLANVFTGNQEISNKGPILTLTDTDAGHDDYVVRNLHGVFSIHNNTDSVTAFDVAGTGGITLNAGADGTYTLTDGNNLVFGSTTGNKIGTATSQKLGFWNATPVIQPADANQAALKNNTGGSYDATLVDVGASYNQENINNNFTDVFTLLDAIRTALVNCGIIKGSS